MFHPFKFLVRVLAEDREAYLQGLALVLASQDRHLDLLVEQTKLLQSLTSTFMTTEKPTSWAVHDEDEVAAEKLRYGLPVD